MTCGRKNDKGKLRWHLLPGIALEAILEVLEHGAEKYEEDNWKQGFDWSRPWNAAQRHLWAWWSGEDKDPESGLSHLAHAGCNIMFLLWFQACRVGNDNRRATSVSRALVVPDHPVALGDTMDTITHHRVGYHRRDSDR